MEKTYKILKLLIWVLLFAVVIAGAYVLYERLSPRVEVAVPTIQLSTQPTDAARESEPAEASTESVPAYTFYDREGNAFTLEDFRGKPVVMSFWATWCGYCTSAMPDIQDAYQELGEDVHFLMVNLTDDQGETVEKAAAMIEEKGYTFPVYFDADMMSPYYFDVYSVPVTYFFDDSGNPVTYYRGMLNRELLDEILAYVEANS